MILTRIVGNGASSPASRRGRWTMSKGGRCTGRQVHRNHQLALCKKGERKVKVIIRIQKLSNPIRSINKTKIKNYTYHSADPNWAEPIRRYKETSHAYFPTEPYIRSHDPIDQDAIGRVALDPWFFHRREGFDVGPIGLARHILV